MPRVPLLCIAMLISVPASAGTLKTAYDLAGPAEGYDRYVVLETGQTYTGGLWIGGTYERITGQFEPGGESVCIVGNGAVIDLQGQEICMAYCQKRLDIADCVILNGGIRFRGYSDGMVTRDPLGTVRYVTFYKPHDYAVRLFSCGKDILIERNIVVDSVDTGPDFMFLTGVFNDWLPTGSSVAPSAQHDFNCLDNWSFHIDPIVNADPLRHFVLLCDFG
jgi:hypothetical protein